MRQAESTRNADIRLTRRNRPTFGLCFIRHGPTQQTVEKKVTGASIDIPLTPKGLAIMQGVGDWLSDSGLDCIYSNKLKRSHESAIAVGQPLNAEIRMMEGLIPQNMGIFAGQVITEVAEELKQYAAHPTKPVPQGESREMFFDRCVKAMRELLEESESDFIGAIGHGQHFAALPAVLKTIRGARPDLATVPVTSDYGPGSVLLISRDGSSITVLRHVAPEKTVS